VVEALLGDELVIDLGDGVAGDVVAAARREGEHGNDKPAKDRATECCDVVHEPQGSLLV
jgi:hypothetical protein